MADLGLEPYLRLWDLQRGLARVRSAGLVPDVLLLTEHEPVFTTGRRGLWHSLHVTRAFLDARGIACLDTDRGGDVTYHGPGQIVGYPVLRVPGGGRRVRAYVEALEAAIIGTLTRFGIDGGRSPGRPGVWVGGDKVASIGLAVRRDVCFHGFALNVDMDLAPFGWIAPCGLEAVRVTSMASILGKSLATTEVRAVLVETFCKVLGYKPERVAASDIRGTLHGS